jgi:hypothetical protein
LADGLRSPKFNGSATHEAAAIAAGYRLPDLRPLPEAALQGLEGGRRARDRELPAAKGAESEAVLISKMPSQSSLAAIREEGPGV